MTQKRIRSTPSFRRECGPIRELNQLRLIGTAIATTPTGSRVSPRPIKPRTAHHKTQFPTTQTYARTMLLQRSVLFATVFLLLALACLSDAKRSGGRSRGSSRGSSNWGRNKYKQNSDAGPAPAASPAKPAATVAKPAAAKPAPKVVQPKQTQTKTVKNEPAVKKEEASKQFAPSESVNKPSNSNPASGSNGQANLNRPANLNQPQPQPQPQPGGTNAAHGGSNAANLNPSGGSNNAASLNPHGGRNTANLNPSGGSNTANLNPSGGSNNAANLHQPGGTNGGMNGNPDASKVGWNVGNQPPVSGPTRVNPVGNAPPPYSPNAPPYSANAPPYSPNAPPAYAPNAPPPYSPNAPAYSSHGHGQPYPGYAQQPPGYPSYPGYQGQSYGQAPPPYNGYAAHGQTGYGHPPPYPGAGGYGMPPPGYPGYGNQGNTGMLGGLFGGSKYGGGGGYGYNQGYSMVKPRGFGSGFGSVLRNVAAGFLIWHVVSGLTRKPYHVHNYYNNPEAVPQEIALPANVITLCDDSVASLCSGNTSPLCTQNNTVLCVALMPATSTSGCEDSSKPCVTSTVSCVGNAQEPECAGDEGRNITITMPCISNATLHGQLDQALVNVTMNVKNGAVIDGTVFCVTTMAAPVPEEEFAGCPNATNSDTNNTANCTVVPPFVDNPNGTFALPPVDYYNNSQLYMPGIPMSNGNVTEFDGFDGFDGGLGRNFTETTETITAELNSTSLVTE